MDDDVITFKVKRTVDAKLYIVDELDNQVECTEKDLYEAGYAKRYEAYYRISDSLSALIGHEQLEKCSALRYLIERASIYDPKFGNLGPLDPNDDEDLTVLEVVKQNLMNWEDTRDVE